MSVPPDSVLIEHLTANRKDLEILAQMAIEDKIEAAWSGPDHPDRLPRQRPADYKALIHRTNLLGIIRMPNDQIFFFVAPHRDNKLEEKHIVFSMRPVNPVISSLDDNGARLQPNTMHYRHVAGSWYLEYQRNG